jgi:pyridoxamine 5'-phosphate oxidase
MKEQEPLEALHRLLAKVKIGTMISNGPKGYPAVRWMTAIFLDRERLACYAVSVRGSAKVRDLEADSRVTWQFQTPSLDEIITVQGQAIVLDNPALKAEVLEALGPNLEQFWKINPDPGKLVVIETSIESITLYRPMEQHRVTREVLS